MEQEVKFPPAKPEENRINTTLPGRHKIPKFQTYKFHIILFYPFLLIQIYYGTSLSVLQETEIKNFTHTYSCTNMRY